MGILNEVKRHLNNWGSFRLSEMEHSFYRELVYEFLAKVSVSPMRDPSLSYRVKGQEAAVDLSTLQRVFRMLLEGILEVPKGGEENAIWNELSGEAVFHTEKAKVHMIKDLPILIVYKWYNQTVFGRKESNKVNKEDLIVLKSLLHPDKMKINMPYQILTILKHMAEPGEWS